MFPKKIIFFTRDTQTPLHCEMARQFGKIYPEAKILFASFFSQSCNYAEEDGFEAFYIPDAMRGYGDKPVDSEWVTAFDAFCRKEGMGLNSMLHTERFLPRCPKAAERFFHQHLAVLDQIIEPNTLGISTMYDHFFYLAAGMLVHFKDGAFFSFVGCGVPANRAVALRLPWETWQNPDQAEDANALMEHCRQEVLLPSEIRIDYMKKRNSNPVLSWRQRCNFARMRKKFADRDVNAGSYFRLQERNRILNAFKRRAKELKYRISAAPWDIESLEDLRSVTGKTVFLALHMEPEATILMYSHRLRDQTEVCRLVAEAVPVGYTVLVKENPKMEGKRPKEFYRALKVFPNVRLVSVSVPSAALIAKAEAVVSLAGTVTVEAFLRGKPAFCFGRPPFQSLATGTGFEQVLDCLANLNRPVLMPYNSQDSSIWRNWVSATLPARVSTEVFDYRIGRMSYDAKPEIARKYVSFISNCLAETAELKSRLL